MRTQVPNRRQFLQGSLAIAGIGVLSGCGLAPSLMQQQAKIPRIGILCAACPPNASIAGMTPNTLGGAFLEGLRDLGYVEGENVAFDIRAGDGRDELLPQLAVELARLPVDLIAVTGGTQAALAAKHATDSIPIVFMSAADPVGNGLVASIARPGGNLTGTTSLVPLPATQ